MAKLEKHVPQDLRSYWDAGKDAGSIRDLGQHCLTPFSKDLQNRDERNVPRSWITRLSQNDDRCKKTRCVWRDNVDSLELRVYGHWDDPAEGMPCDQAPEISNKWATICVPSLVTRLVREVPKSKGRTEEGRGLHAGCFTWKSSDGAVLIQGELQGLTNLGTIRSWKNLEDELTAANPGLDPATAKAMAKRITLKCNAQGYFEGRLHGRVIETSNSKLAGARVVGLYRFYTDPTYYYVPSKTAQLTGLIEGVLITRCGS